MPWVRIDENALDHPKILPLTDGAFRLWVHGLAYCQKFLTDGAINRHALKSFRGASRARIEELTRSGLWETAVDGFHVHDYLRWNDSRDHVLKARQAARARLDRFRQKQRVSPGREETLHTPLHSTPHPSVSTEQKHSTREKFFSGERFSVSHRQHDVVMKELGDRALSLDFPTLYERWDADLVASGEQIDTLEYIKRRALEAVKAIRASGPTYQDRDYCDHQPRCHNRTWHAAKAADELSKRGA